MTFDQALDRIAELEEQVRQLEGRLGYDVMFPKAMGLTKRQSRILGVIAASGLATYESLIESMYPNDPAGGPDCAKKCLEVSMCHLRRRVARDGITILTRQGVGYEVIDESLTILRRIARLKAKNADAV